MKESFHFMTEQNNLFLINTGGAVFYEIYLQSKKFKRGGK